MKNELTTNANTQITKAAAPTTLGEWVTAVLPVPTLEALAIQKKKVASDIGDISVRALGLAAVAHNAKSMDSIAALPAPMRAEAITHLSLRTMFELLSEGVGGGRAEMLRLQYNVGIDTLVDNLALQYFGARLLSSPEDRDGEVLRAGIADAIRRDYAAFSPAEIKEAFAVMAKRENINAYGRFTVQFLHAVLGTYKSARSRALNILLDKEREIANNLSQLEIIAKNDKAFEDAKNEFADLAICNTRHASFYSCPHNVVRRFVEETLIEATLDEKKAIMREARAFLAYDILADAATITNRKAAQTFFSALEITPKASPRPAGTSDLVKALGVVGFDYANPTQKQFEELAGVYYAKMLYFSHLAPFEGVKK